MFLKLHSSILVSFILLLCIHIISNARVKEFFDIEMATCTNPNTEKFLIQFPGAINHTFKDNVVSLHGNFTVTEVIQEPLEFIVVAHRCTMNMKTCEPFNTIALSRICTYINDENGMLASFFRTMEPNLRCPIRPGLYRFVNSTMNLKFFTAFPIEGYRWQASLKLYSKEKGVKRELYCLSGHASMKWVKKA
ncbi:conserved hypothetical protein [Culex quinquefasciatus]|uniref:MD-2-related lipid-recognition domain-containing protein n=1 Tax=Culex quinquefasciatus TaxID=7176 RepID=B0WU41_CULQU|nr:conserved hypothetical protein [Culex quinquefasciatus]|eukprot:XP_001857720.1 conserved hypothetical protein [Culex quinquefasciatus]